MKLTDTLRTVIAKSFGYHTQGEGFEKVHYSLTRLNALRWAHCYQAATVTRNGKFVAAVKCAKVTRSK